MEPGIARGVRSMASEIMHRSLTEVPIAVTLHVFQMSVRDGCSSSVCRISWSSRPVLACFCRFWWAG